MKTTKKPSCNCNQRRIPITTKILSLFLPSSRFKNINHSSRAIRKAVRIIITGNMEPRKISVKRLSKSTICWTKPIWSSSTTRREKNILLKFTKCGKKSRNNSKESKRKWCKISNNCNRNNIKNGKMNKRESCWRPTKNFTKTCSLPALRNLKKYKISSHLLQLKIITIIWLVPIAVRVCPPQLKGKIKSISSKSSIPNQNPNEFQKSIKDSIILKSNLQTLLCSNSSLSTLSTTTTTITTITWEIMKNLKRNQ